MCILCLQAAVKALLQPTCTSRGGHENLACLKLGFFALEVCSEMDQRCRPREAKNQQEAGKTFRLNPACACMSCTTPSAEDGSGLLPTAKPTPLQVILWNNPRTTLGGEVFPHSFSGTILMRHTCVNPWDPIMEM